MALLLTSLICPPHGVARIAKAPSSMVARAAVMRWTGMTTMSVRLKGRLY